jgi:hypothetical protein
MLITTAAFLVAGGLAFYLFGETLDAREIAFIGGVVILGTGVVLTGGLEVQDGTTVEKAYTTVDNQTVVDNETTTIQTRPVSLPQRLSLGFLVMIVGGTAALRAVNPE